MAPGDLVQILGGCSTKSLVKDHGLVIKRMNSFMSKYWYVMGSDGQVITCFYKNLRVINENR